MPGGTRPIDLQSLGAATFIAGGGVDTLVMDWSAAQSAVYYGASYYYTYVEGYGYAYMHHSDVERWQLSSGAGNDVLHGGALDDILDGGAARTHSQAMPVMTSIWSIMWATPLLRQPTAEPTRSGRPST